MSGFFLAALIIGGILMFFSMRANYQAEIARNAASGANDWFVERDIAPDSVQFETYRDPALSSMPDAYVVVGVGKKRTGEDAGFIAEVTPGRRTEGVELTPPGAASHHRRCAHEAKLRGVSLIEIMTGGSHTGSNEGAISFEKKRQEEMGYKSRIEDNFENRYGVVPKQDQNTACTNAFLSAIDRAWSGGLAEEEATLYAATVYYGSLMRYSLYAQSRRVLEGMEGHIEEAARNGNISTARIEESAKAILEAQKIAGTPQDVGSRSGHNS